MTDARPNAVADRPRLVVLASGGGTNCQALIDACASGTLNARVVAVITNNPTAGVLARAEAAGIESLIVDHRGADPEIRRRADEQLVAAVRNFGADLVVLAGWMRILGAQVGAALPMINLHPAKPGEFPGIRSIERSFDAWKNGDITESGVMVHWVPDEGVDVGPVIVTESVPFVDGESFDGFATRLHTVEHRLIVAGTTQALADLCR